MSRFAAFLRALWVATLRVFGLACPVRLEHAVPRRDKKARSLIDIVRECPSLFGPSAVYYPTPLLGNGDIATVFAAKGRSRCSTALLTATADFSAIDNVQYERRLLRLPDDGTIGLDFSPPFSEVPPDNRPLLFLVHGLTGGSHESYIRNLVAHVTKPKSRGGLGWRAVVGNYRGCAAVPITSKFLLHAGWTVDIRRAMLYISTILPEAPIVACGFSLGANIITRYLGEEGDRTPVKAAVALSSPWDLWKGHVALDSSIAGAVYSRAMSKNLRTLLKAHLHVFEKDDRLRMDHIYGNERASLFEFDELVTRVLGGFSSVSEYYRTQSAVNVLDDVRVPLLAIHARNDPITTAKALPQEITSPYFVLATTSQGGHLGWWTGFRKDRWVKRPTAEFLAVILREDASPRPHPTTAVPGPDGFTLDRDDPNIGFKVVDVGEFAGGLDEPSGPAETMRGF